MDFEQLGQLDAVARAGSMSAAAEETGYSQPTLSRSMRRLEGELGCRLFDRTKNSVSLNGCGRVAVDYARELLRTKRHMVDALREEAGRGHSVSVDTCAPAPLWWLAARLLDADPDVSIRPRLVDESAVERAMMGRETDFAVTTHELRMPGVVCRPIMSESLSACVPEGHPLAGRTSVSWADLDGRDFLVLSGIGVWWDVVRQRLRHARFQRIDDRVLFHQLAASTERLVFCTDRTSLAQEPGWGAILGSRSVVPIDEPDATVRFHLSYPVSMSKKAEEAIGPVQE